MKLKMSKKKQDNCRWTIFASFHIVRLSRFSTDKKNALYIQESYFFPNVFFPECRSL